MCLINGDEQPLWVFPSLIPVAVCDTIAAERRDWSPGEVGHGAAGVRRSAVAFLEAGHWITGVLDRCAWEANERAGWQYQLSASEAVQHARYDAEGGYGWHVDTFPALDGPRKLTIVTQLSARGAYTGGALELRRHGVEEPDTYPMPGSAAEQGSVIVFPSFLLHRVTPLLRGQRHTLTSWVRGPRFA